jgi:hypothetical protein
MGSSLEREETMEHTDKSLEDSPRARVRGIDEFTADELALLKAKLEGWIRQTTPKSGGKRPRHQFVMKSRHTGQSADKDASDSQA